MSDTVKEETGMAEISVALADDAGAARGALAASDLISTDDACPFCGQKLSAEVMAYVDGSVKTLFRCECGFRFEHVLAGLRIPVEASKALERMVTSMYDRAAAAAMYYRAPDAEDPAPGTEDGKPESRRELFLMSDEEFKEDKMFCLVHRDFDPSAPINRIQEKYVKMIVDDYHRRGASLKKLSAKYEMPGCKLRRLLKDNTVMRVVRRNTDPCLPGKILSLHGKGYAKGAIARELGCSWGKVDAVIKAAEGGV